MRITAERGFVLQARPWRETSLLLEILTANHGRVGAVARGVVGPKRQVQRAALQIWQHVEIAAVQHGELWALRSWEALDVAPRYSGNVALAGFYVAELLLRLVQRQDPAPEVYARHIALRDELWQMQPLAWCLRRYERDLLAALGFALPWGTTADGTPLDPAARYRVDPEHGALRILADGWREPMPCVSGAALLALATDRRPAPADLADLRLMLRAVLGRHLGDRPLKSWGLLAEMTQAVSKNRQRSAAAALEQSVDSGQ